MKDVECMRIVVNEQAERSYKNISFGGEHGTFVQHPIK